MIGSVGEQGKGYKGGSLRPGPASDWASMRVCFRRRDVRVKLSDLSLYALRSTSRAWSPVPRSVRPSNRGGDNKDKLIKLERENGSVAPCLSIASPPLFVSPNRPAESVAPASAAHRPQPCHTSIKPPLRFLRGSPALVSLETALRALTLWSSDSAERWAGV